MAILTLDNLLLSRPKMVEKTDARPSAFVCKNEAAGPLPTLFAKASPPILAPPISPILPISRAGEGGYRRSPRPSQRTSPRTQTL